MKCECQQDPCPTCRKIAAFRVRSKEDGTISNRCTRCNLGIHTTIARLYDEQDIPRLIELDAGSQQNEFDLLMDLLGGMPTLLRGGLERWPRYHGED